MKEPNDDVGGIKAVAQDSGPAEDTTDDVGGISILYLQLHSGKE
jgi:hypothetical protein